MTFALAVKELKRNAAFFFVCFLITVISVVSAYLGMRIVDSATIIVHGSEFFLYKSMFYLEGGFLFAASVLLCFFVLFLAYLAFPSRYQRNLQILRDLGAGMEHFISLFIFQTALFALPATVIGIAVGETLIRTNMQFFLGVCIPLGSLSVSIYRTFLLFVIVFLLLSFLVGTVYFKNKPINNRKTGRLIRLGVSGGMPVSCVLGALSFFRRKRPVSALIALCLVFICFVTYSGMLSYAAFLNTTPLESCIYDVQVTVSASQKQTYEEVTRLLNGYDSSSWRDYSPSKSSGRTILTDYSVTVSVLSDDDFNELAGTVTLLPSDGGRKAILQNSAYDAQNHYKPIIFAEDTSVTISGKLSDDISLDIIGYLDEIPLKYSSGYAGMTASACRLFVKQSEFPEYGENDVYIVWFSGSSKEQTQLLKEKISDIDGVSVKDMNADSDILGVPVQFVYSTLTLFTPLVALFFILYFHRDVQSRKDEINLLYSLGMGKGKMFAYLLVDYLFIVILLLSITASVSAVLLRIIHFLAVGYYAPFFMPYTSLLMNTLFQVGIVIFYNLFYVIGKKSI